MNAQTPRPIWRHPGFLLLYAVAVTVLMLVVARGLVVMVGPAIGDLASVMLVAAVFVSGFVLFRRLFEAQSASEFAIRSAIPDLAVGILFGVLVFSAVVGVIAAFGGYRIAGYNDAAAMFPALVISILSGFTEEIVFRGFLMRLSEQWLGTWAGLAISSILFALAHLTNDHVDAVAVIAIVEAGVMLGAIYLLTRRLWMAVAVHGAWNFAQGGIFGIAVSGESIRGIIRPEIRGSDLLTGGAFGAEASLPAVAVLAIVSAGLLVIAWRRGSFIPPLWIRKRQGAGEQA